MSNYTSEITTVNGTYRVGMQKSEAEKNNSYKCFYGIDFKDLDKDQNNVLSLQEILEGQVKLHKRNAAALGLGFGGMAVAGVALACTGIGAVADVAMLGTAAGATTIGEAIAFTGGGSVVAGTGGICGYSGVKSEYSDYKKAVEELKKYKKDAEAQKADANYKKTAIYI